METRYTPERPNTRAAATGRRIVGYGAVFYKPGAPGTEYRLLSDLIERIMPGAFDRAIRDDDVRGLFNHDSNMVLGRNKAGTMTLRADTVGLAYDIAVNLDTTTGRDTLGHVERRDVTGSSFSFIVEAGGDRWRREGNVDIREILSVQLFDVGPVTFPAYDATTAEARKAHIQDAIDAREAWRGGRLQDWQINAAHRGRQLRLRELEAGL